MSEHLTVEELSALMKRSAGVTVAPEVLAARPDAEFADYGLDSLGLLGIVAELEKRHGHPLPIEVEHCKTPGAFLDLVNDCLMTGA
ncbi:acyl carrier protein [Streptomyces sp. NPDC012888]|uniref:acyl carrier protein n=1 Tax=Streptomyces sp. NPDC012888 TaxID=3364855 RepID=UPI003683D20C